MLSAAIARIDAAFDEHPFLLLLGFSMVFLGACVVTAATTPFDSDEVMTVLTSQMPSRTVVWAALAEGVDDAPPMYATVLRAVQAVTGVGHVATRLPAIVGAWIAVVVVLFLVRRRANATLGLAASLACAIVLYPFATEARGYAPAAACVAVALYAWTQLPEYRWRPFYAALLAAALGTATWWHDTAALAFVPFVIGELFRWWSRSRPDWLAWGAIAAAAVATLPLIRLVGVSIPGVEPERVRLIARMTGAYGVLFEPLGTPLLLLAWLAALSLAIWTIALVVANRDVDLAERRLRGYEIAAAVGFALIPAIAAGLAALFGFEIGARDLAFAIPGLAAAMMVFLATFTPRSGVADLVVVTALALSFGGTAATSVLSASTTGSLVSRPAALAPSATGRVAALPRSTLRRTSPALPGLAACPSPAPRARLRPRSSALCATPANPWCSRPATTRCSCSITRNGPRRAARSCLPIPTSRRSSRRVPEATSGSWRSRNGRRSGSSPFFRTPLSHADFSCMRAARTG